MWAALTKDFAEIASNIKSDSMHFVNMLGNLANDVIGDNNYIYAGDESLWGSAECKSTLAVEEQSEIETQKVTVDENKSDNTNDGNNVEFTNKVTPIGYSAAQYKERAMPAIDNTELIDLQGNDATYLTPITDTAQNKELEKEFAIWKATHPLSSYNLKRELQKSKQQQHKEHKEQESKAITKHDNEDDHDDNNNVISVVSAHDKKTGVNDFATPARATKSSENNNLPSPSSSPLSTTSSPRSLLARDEPAYAVRQRLLDYNEVMLDKYVNLVGQDVSPRKSHQSNDKESKQHVLKSDKLPSSSSSSENVDVNVNVNDNTNNNNNNNSKEDSNTNKTEHLPMSSSTTSPSKDISVNNTLPSSPSSLEPNAYVNKKLSEDEFFDRYFFRLTQLRECAAKNAINAHEEDNSCYRHNHNNNDNNASNNNNNNADTEKKSTLQEDINKDNDKNDNEAAKDNKGNLTSHAGIHDSVRTQGQTSEPSSFAERVFYAASKLAANLDDVINLGMNAREESSDDENVTPPSSSLETSPIKHTVSRKAFPDKHVEACYSDNNEEMHDITQDKEHKYEDGNNNRKADHTVENNKSINDKESTMEEYRVQIAGLESVIQQLQDHLRASNQRICTLTKLLEEHNIPVPSSLEQESEQKERVAETEHDNAAIERKCNEKRNTTNNENTNKEMQTKQQDANEQCIETAMANSNASSSVEE